MTIPLMGRAGLKIRAVDGFEELGHPEILSTPLFYHANPGDKLTLSDDAYKFNVATYRPEIDERWLYTYAYAPDQSWTNYNHDLSGDSYRQGEYTFEENVYFRICLRKVNGEIFDGTEDINDILTFLTSTLQRKSKPWISAEVQRISKHVNEQKKPDSTILLLLTDTHYTVNGTWEDTIQAIDMLSQEISLDGIIHLGDMTDGLVTGEVTRHYVRIMLDALKRNGIPVWVTIGNHDTNYFQNNTERFTCLQQSKLYNNKDDIRFYIDISGFRLIFLDSYDPDEQQRYGYNKECIKWLTKTLEGIQENCKAIVFSHLPPITRLQFWTNAIRGEKELIEVLNQHKNKIYAWINGHNHADRLDNEEGFPIISITNAKCEAFYERKTEGFITPYRKLGEVSQEAFDIVILNKSNEEARFIRFGAGKDRHISNRKVEWV